MTTYYKAIRPDGGSFHAPGFMWATEPGGVTTHPDYRGGDGADGYLSVATVPTDCTGMRWPCRLLEVEPVGDVFTPDPAGLPNKRAGKAFRTVREVDAHAVFGPQGVHVVELIERAGRLTPDEAVRLKAAEYAARVAARDAAECAAWDATRYAAWYAARVAARDATRVAAWYAARVAARVAARDAAECAAWDAAWYAAEALVVRDLIGSHGFTQQHYDALTGPWASAISPAHPDDGKGE